jgi:hypothetical protein
MQASTISNAPLFLGMRNVLLMVACLFPIAVTSQEQPLPQANARVWIENGSSPASFERFLRGGKARLTGSIWNLRGGETALVLLAFDYKTDADISLDEILSSIVISTEGSGGNRFSEMAIDPNMVHLNPNRVPLHYSATLYTPPHKGPGNGYFVRVQVFGNYE